MHSNIALAEKIAPQLDISIQNLKRAALLAKADLTSNMVCEFPELQGFIGRYYAALDGEDKDVAIAIEEHYMPIGKSGRIPSTRLGAALAVVDKLDTLNQMFKNDIKPNGSKDPYALRRCAISILRIAAKFDFHINFKELNIEESVQEFIEKRKEQLEYFNEK